MDEFRINESWLREAEKMMQQTASADERMKQLEKELHRLAAQQLFEIFPSLSDQMNAEEIRRLGELISRRLQSLTHDLQNFAYTVERH